MSKLAGDFRNILLFKALIYCEKLDRKKNRENYWIKICFLLLLIVFFLLIYIFNSRRYKSIQEPINVEDFDKNFDALFEFVLGVETIVQISEKLEQTSNILASVSDISELEIDVRSFQLMISELKNAIKKVKLYTPKVKWSGRIFNQNSISFCLRKSEEVITSANTSLLRLRYEMTRIKDLLSIELIE